jgi:hypothetical protein
MDADMQTEPRSPSKRRIMANRITSITRKEPPEVRLMLRFFLIENSSFARKRSLNIQPKHVERAHELCRVFRERWPDRND